MPDHEHSPSLGTARRLAVILGMALWLVPLSGAAVERGAARTIGNVAPEIELITGNTTTIKFSSLRGKWVILQCGGAWHRKSQATGQVFARPRVPEGVSRSLSGRSLARKNDVSLHQPRVCARRDGRGKDPGKRPRQRGGTAIPAFLRFVDERISRRRQTSGRSPQGDSALRPDADLPGALPLYRSGHRRVPRPDQKAGGAISSQWNG